jgi:ActR/RegA family two-component response regulator
MAKILVVDDSREELNLIVNALMARRHTVIPNGGHISDVEKPDLASITVAIVDLVLDDSALSGLRVVRDLRRRRPSVTIIVITSFPSNELNYKSMKAGADYFVARDDAGTVDLIDQMIAVAETRERSGRAGAWVVAAISAAGSAATVALTNYFAGQVGVAVGFGMFVSLLVVAGLLKRQTVKVGSAFEYEVE